MDKQKSEKKVNQKKAETVADLKEKVEKAKAFFLTDYQGLTHPQLEKLKKSLKKVEGEFVITKNTLLKLALENSKLENQNSKDIYPQLNNPTATLFAYGDEIAAVKTLADFIKISQLPKIKVGFFSGKIASSDDFAKLSSLPSLDILRTMLVIGMKQPIYGLHYALKWNMQKLVTALSNIKKQ